MKKKAKNMILIFAFLLVCWFLYCIYVHYVKKNILKNLLGEITKQLKMCYIEKDKSNRYKNDYYISIGTTSNRNSHIHLVTNIHNLQYFFIPNANIGYIFKNNNQHSNRQLINFSEPYHKICKKIIYGFENFLNNT